MGVAITPFEAPLRRMVILCLNTTTFGRLKVVCFADFEPKLKPEGSHIEATYCLPCPHADRGRHGWVQLHRIT